MKQSTRQLLKELSEVNGVPGFESQVGRIVERELKPVATVSRDNLGSVIGEKAGSEKGPKVMLAGHMDEIGFMVRLVTKEGYIKFATLGGWWNQVLLSQRVVIQTQKGEVPGFIASKPPHLLEDEERRKPREIKDMFIDVGAKDEAEATKKLGIRPGDPIVPWSPFTEMANRKLLAGKAWDDRAGVALAIETVKAFRGKRHPNVLYGVGTVQEEVGLRGAQTAVQSISPDVALILEVAIAEDVPGVSEDGARVKLGSGVAIYLLEGSMIPNFRLRELAIETCDREKIPYTTSILQRGGTDGGRIHVHARGVPSLVIGVPTRHIHSHAGILHADDFDSALRLVIALVERLDAKTVASLAAG